MNGRIAARVALGLCIVALLAAGATLGSCNRAPQASASTAPATLRKLVSGAPNVTEILYALGLGMLGFLWGVWSFRLRPL